MVYAYDGDRLLSKTNLLDEATQQNEYNTDEKLAVEFDDYVKMLYSYDSRGNRILTVERYADGDDIQSVTLREITYE